MASETCTVRPELIEFDKNNNTYLSIVAHPEGFKFMNTATATNTAGNISTELNYDNANLASIYTNTINTESLMVDNFTVKTLSTGTADAITVSSNVIDMNQTGHMINTDAITFYDVNPAQMTTISNDSIVFGSANGIFNVQDGTIDNIHIMNMTPVIGVFDVNQGSIQNVLNQTMFANGQITFPTGGKIDMKNGVSHLGEIDISTNVIENRTAGASVFVESSVFEDENITTTNIHPLTTEVNVFNAKFTADKIAVQNIDTNTITAIGGADAGNVDLNLVAPGVGVIDCNNSRVSNVLNPVHNSDVANKSYVLQAVANNVQGLKPKKACDYAIFGDQWNNKQFGVSFNVYNYQLFENSSDAELALVFDTTQTDIYFSDKQATETELNASYNAEQNDLMPKIERKRILINGLRKDGTVITYNPTTGLAAPSGFTGISDALIKGLNGIWEVKRYDINSSPKALILTRAQDMDEAKEVMNNAYTYLNATGSGYSGEAQMNFGYVVTNADPITLNGLYTSVDGVNSDELVWVTFNNVNYELDFLDSNGQRLEDGVAANAFNKGGLLMRNVAGLPGEKQIMTDHNLLNYDVIDKVLSARGDVKLYSSDAGDNICSITAFKNDDSPDGILELNGTLVKANVNGETEYHVDQVHATQVNVYSDRTLKTNIEAMIDGLDLVSKFKPVTYNWTKDPSNPNPEFGFIAQDVRENFPSLVKENPDNGVLSVDYMKITSILVAAVQELSTEVKSLKAQLNA
jgi:hypothetical protein